MDSMITRSGLIRIATPDDVAAMFVVRTSVTENHLSMDELAQRGITPESLPGMLTGEGCGWVALCDDEVVAFAMANAAEATVYALFVLPGHEGRGFGRALLDACEAWLAQRGCQRVWLLTDADLQVRANGFYRHLGWQDEGVQPDGQTLFVKHLPA